MTAPSFPMGFLLLASLFFALSSSHALTSLRSLEDAPACDFDNLIAGGCSISDYCSASPLAMLGDTVCFGNTTGIMEFQVLLPEGCYRNFDDDDDDVSVPWNDTIPFAHCTQVQLAFLFDNATLIKQQILEYTTHPVTGVVRILSDMEECNSTQGTMFGNRAYCDADPCLTVSINDIPCGPCQDCNGSPHFLDCSNIDANLVNRCDGSNRLDPAALVAYFAGATTEAPTMAASTSFPTALPTVVLAFDDEDPIEQDDGVDEEQGDGEDGDQEDAGNDEQGDEVDKETSNSPTTEGYATSGAFALPLLPMLAWLV